MARLTDKQAKLVGRIRDAFVLLGYIPAHAPVGSPGTAVDLAEMAPIVGRFAVRVGSDFVEKIRSTKDLDTRAAFIADAAERMAAKLPAAKVMTAVNILGEGFVAYRKAKHEKDKMATLVGVVEQFTAAVGR